MNNFRIGDIVVRKSYGADAYFRIVNIIDKSSEKPIYVLRGLIFRLEADSCEDDLIKRDSKTAFKHIRDCIQESKRQILSRSFVEKLDLMRLLRGRAGSILHIDSSQEFMNTCLKHYSESRINATGKCLAESDQPNYVRRLLERYRPEVLVITGHDSIKKNSDSIYSLNNYSNSRYYIQSVKEARSFEPDRDKLCIFAGACQSYFEALMDAGANFASSPGRVLINALDPAIVAQRISLTDSKVIVSPQEITKLTVSGSAGIGGIKTRGHMLR